MRSSYNTNNRRSTMSATNPTSLVKPLATPDLAQDLGAWAAGYDIATIVVFGVDVIFAVQRDGEQVAIPRQFNDVVWGLDMLKVVQAAFKATQIMNCCTAPDDLAITFEAGILPGDPGFELPEPTFVKPATQPTESLLAEVFDG